MDSHDLDSLAPAVRWDRRLKQSMAASAGSPASVSGPAVARLTVHGRRVREMVLGVMKRLLKGPLVRVRSFLIAPLSGRLDAIQGSSLMQQRFQSEIADRLRELEGTVALAHENIGFLHRKADESAIKSRPVVHLRNAYAVPLSDGYLFIPEEEEALLLMYAGAGAAGLEPGTRSILQAVLQPGGFAVDVGASVGLHTIALARAVGPSGRVEAFEAEPRLAPFLERTLQVNGMSQVNLHELALGARNGTVSFNVARTIGHSSLYALDEPGSVREQVRVRMKRLDSVIPAKSRVDVMKIDVEGAELDVLHGARRVLADSPECAIVAECGPSHLQRTGHAVEDWFAEFAEFGFQPYAIAEPTGELHRLVPRWAAAQHSVNVLFLRSGSAVEQKLLRRFHAVREAL
jgi:FkbM family methyltransferase